MPDPQQSSSDPTPATPARTLLTARVLWYALVAGSVTFLIFIAMLITRGLTHPIADDAAQLLTRITWAMLLVALPLGYFLRMQCYKRHWRGELIAPQGYLVGNLILWALCEGCLLATLGVTLLVGTLWPAVAPALIALAVLFYNHPDGRAMFARGVTPRISDAVE